MKLKYILVLLSKSSVSFCNYNSLENQEGLISLQDLKNTVVFALKNNLKVNFLYPDFDLDKSYEELIEEVEHVKIIPFSQRKKYEKGILVLDSKRLDSGEKLDKLEHANVILKLQKEYLPVLSSQILKLLPKTERINLILMDVETYSEDDYAVYEQQLDKIAKKIVKISGEKDIPELNFLTDRTVLTQMNNCEAGINHLTVAPNGKLYLCPAFYYDNEASDLGVLRNEIEIKNAQLLELKYAPICRVCDAFQCKRCVFLNKKNTLEFNTPSAQQCITSHIEREASRKLLQSLSEVSGEENFENPIPEIAYRDPFEIVKRHPQPLSDIFLK